ncbi:hypothetical protein H4218_000621 [Coemansia sp. IMI 209128]|nr:hypothetical protein GGI10_002807 [Coemansia sp. RSA 2530]KAJ2702909.1 hypothetical protein H4218_000621 [Coemansia sp. IMI 209128]
MSLSHDTNGCPPDTHSPASAAAPLSGGSLSNLLGGSSPPGRPQHLPSASIGTDAERDAGNATSRKQVDSARDSIEGDEPQANPPHARSTSNSSGPQHVQMSPESSPYYNGRNSQSFHMPLGQQRRSSASGHGGESTPPAIRYTHSEAHPHANRGSFSSGNNGAGQGLGNMHLHGNSTGGGGGSGNGPDEGKNMYQLWLPWEETALVDWLYEPTNCKLFNEPRRKKECHERIIREILSGKTSRSIEGKIRTLEKRYYKASMEIQRADFASAHPGKQPLEVAEALCINFHKLETIFKSGLTQQSAPSQQHPQKKAWVAGSPASESGAASQGIAAGSPFDQRTGSPPNGSKHTAAGVAGSMPLAGTSLGSNAEGGSANVLSIPRASPPRISAAESLPYRAAGQSRKLAPKRGLDGSLLPDGGNGATTATDADGPVMMSSGKRSRTFPAMLQTRHSPARHVQPADPRQTAADTQQHLHQSLASQQRSPMAMQMQIPPAYLHQQPLYYQRPPEHPRNIPYHYPMDAAVAAAAACGTPNSARSTGAAGGQQQLLAPTQPQMGNGIGGAAAGPPVAAQAPLSSSTPQGANMAMPSIRETQDAPGAAQHSAAIMGTREELEWLQFNLRREELEFRKTVFVHEQDLENKRMRIEENRLEVQKKEMDVEAKRIDMQTKQMELQMDSLRSLSGMLSQMVTQMGSLITSKSDSGSKGRRRDSVDSLDE